MKTYDLVIIGTGSAMNIVEPYLNRYPKARIAVIDKDPPGGICLNKGCVPSKLLVYPAELVRMLDDARQLGIEIELRRVDFEKIMARMRETVARDVADIQKGIESSENIDYYPTVAQFTGPGRLLAGGNELTGGTIVLGLGSRPYIPPIKGLDRVGCHTSDSILNLQTRPDRMAIIGGGYIAAEYGHFFAAMGSRVIILGRNSRFLPQEEPEISDLARRELSRHMQIKTGCEVIAVAAARGGGKQLRYRDQSSGRESRLEVDEVLLAAGRASNSDLLHPKLGDVQTDEKGWIVVDPHLRTSAPNVWALGDAIGKHPFKHVANYQSKILYYNAVMKRKIRTDYHAVPHAVFCYPEVAAVGLTEKAALAAYGPDRLWIGFHRYRDTTKGDAMAVGEFFVKTIVERESGRILGAHIIGPQASVLIQEVVTLMYSESPTLLPITAGMHIHPSLSEVVERAFLSLMSPKEYHQAQEARQR